MSKNGRVFPVLSPADVEMRQGTTAYPPEYRAAFEGRSKRALGNALGLTQFGVNHTTLAPGAASALRHWHVAEDEFVYVLEGELTLVMEGGEHVLRSGEAAGFPAGLADGHQLVNRSDAPATYLEIGSRFDEDEAHYPDVDLHVVKRGGIYHFTRKDGTPVE